MGVHSWCVQPYIHPNNYIQKIKIRENNINNLGHTCQCYNDNNNLHYLEIYGKITMWQDILEVLKVLVIQELWGICYVVKLSIPKLTLKAQPNGMDNGQPLLDSLTWDL